MQPVMYNFHSNKSHIPPSLPFYQFKPPSSAHLRDPSLRFGMTKSGLARQSDGQLPNALRAQLVPFGVKSDDQHIFLFSAPIFYLFFSCNRTQCVIGFFKINQLINIIFFCKPINQPALMLPNPTLQIIGHTDIHYLICSIG